MKHWIFLVTAMVVSIPSLAFDPADVYILKFGHGIPASGDTAIAQANSVGAAAAGAGGGLVAGGLTAVLGTAINLTSSVNNEELHQATVVGLHVGADGVCNPEVITFPFRNLQRDKSVLPLRWVRLEKNSNDEFMIKPLIDKAAIKRHPCYQQYLGLMKDKSPKFDPDIYYQ